MDRLEGQCLAFLEGLPQTCKGPNMSGTPKTLNGAITNGIPFNDEFTAAQAESIETHVRDFLSQKFTTAMIANLTLTELWELIIKKEENGDVSPSKS